MQRAVDLDDKSPPIRKPPQAVEVAAPPESVYAHGLLHRPRQPRGTAEPDEVDLAECVRTLRNVLCCGDQDGSVPHPWGFENGVQELTRSDQTLLHHCREKAARRTRAAEAASRQDRGRRGTV